jgi:hypothetical protein
MRTKILFFASAALAVYVAGCGSSSDTTETPAPGPTAGTGAGPGAGGTTGTDAAAGMGGAAGLGGAAGAAGLGGSTAAGAGGTTGGPDGGDDSSVDGGGVGGAGGAAGDDSGVGGAAGTAGAGGATVAPPVDKCEGKTPQRPLPYTVGSDFTNPQTIPDDANPARTRWVRIAKPDCVNALPMVIPAEFPAAPAEAGAGDGGAPEASADDGAVVEAGGDGAAVVEAGDDGAAVVEAGDVEAGDDAAAVDDGAVAVEAGDDSAAVVDAAAEAIAETGALDGAAPDVSVVTDGGVVAETGAGDGGGGIPACWGFFYDPDPCLANGGGCWAGVIFESVLMGEIAAKAAPGICIAPGATTLEFEARAVNIAGGGSLQFKFGSTREGPNVTEQWVTITSAWAKYSIPIGDPDYRSNSSAQYGVFNGFSAVAEEQNNPGGVHLQVRNMIWNGPGGG